MNWPIFKKRKTILQLARKLACLSYHTRLCKLTNLTTLDELTCEVTR